MTFDLQAAKDLCKLRTRFCPESPMLNAVIDQLEAAIERIEELEAENITLSVLGKRKIWRVRKLDRKKNILDQMWPYASLIFILNDFDEMRKWVSKNKEAPSDFLARILNEKQGSQGQWQEYLLSELDISKKQTAKIQELEAENAKLREAERRAHP